MIALFALILLTLPVLVADVALWLAFVAALGAAFGAVAKWIWPPIRKSIADDVVETQVKPSLEPINQQLGEIKHLISYHLGTNGTTPSVREKVLVIETEVRNLKDDVADLRRGGVR